MDSISRVSMLPEPGGAPSLAFRQALLSIDPSRRDGWFDSLLGLSDVPEDGPELPRGCVPYLPCSIDALLRVIEHAGITERDVFVDFGSGTGRAAVLTHLLTGAGAIGIEIQPQLVRVHRELSARLGLARCPVVPGDAVRLADYMTIGTVFFLYCPFSGRRLSNVLESLRAIARTRRIRVCCVDLELGSEPWLSRLELPFNDVFIYRSTIEEFA